MIWDRWWIMALTMALGGLVVGFLCFRGVLVAFKGTLC